MEPRLKMGKIEDTIRYTVIRRAISI